MRLSWNCLENSTSSRCFLIHKENGKIEHRPRPGDCQCTFRRLSLHGGVTLRVSVAVGQRTLREELLYANPGAEGTAARGFSCVIYRADFMNCSWTQGPAAPSDVQYFLYIGDTERKNETECPHYMQDSGTHRGCHLQDLSALPFNAFFLVNGTSRQAEIQFLDSILSTKEIEQISPPDNVSVACNASHCLVQWDQPRTRAGLSDGDFQYQLGIWRQNAEALSEDPVVVAGDVQNRYLVPSPGPGARHTLRIRAADARGGAWGAWGPPVDFGSQGPEASLLHVYLLVVLGTLVCALVLGCLFNRFHGLRGLFPPIPQIKDKVNQNHQMNWEDLATGVGKEDHEEVLVVEEVS
ncbi:granulocyte-macrophage colony-stimulating factor receptor subunit alpha-like isoform X3 [Sciurus carolinensis]|nr:granulocyte-macrophage colony-stimulating factor receptor subunit alpha-like isoform X3 [Sciurus carolinensis]